MKTTDLFKTTSSKINESLQKTFGKKLKLETFSIEQLEDARNKLRTQVHQMRSNSKFNENIENETFLEAQWMLDAINAELAEREEQVLERDDDANEVARELFAKGVRYNSVEDEEEIMQMMIDMGYGKQMNHPDFIPDVLGDLASMSVENEDYNKDEYDEEGEMEDSQLNVVHDAAKELQDIIDDDDNLPEWVQSKITKAMDYLDTARDYMASNEEPEKDDMKESIIKESEIDEASAIVTAKTMVDKVGRWIEELSGMENDTLLSLGDSIRDQMGSEKAKQFISATAPAIEDALSHLKQTRDDMSTALRVLTGEESGAEMLGDVGDEGDVDIDMDVEPDTMNLDVEEPEDDFGAAEPAVGGIEDAGRAKRESVDRSGNLMKILAG